MQTYILKHEDEQVAIIDCSDDLLTIQNMSLNMQNIKHYPIGVKDGRSLQEWLALRSIPFTRENLRMDLLESGMNTFQLLLLNKGLSLTDHYWLCPVDNLQSWSDVNLFENDFNALWSFDFEYGEITPSISLNGDLKKKWVIDSKGKRLLLKACRQNTTRQCVAECFASAIHRKQNKAKFVDYKPVTIDHRIGVVCENFVTSDTEFISASSIYNLKKKQNDVSMYEHYIQLCESNGVASIRDFLEYQIMTDFIITNEDRHFNNFGVIRDSKTLQWLEPAPIFDSGNALCYSGAYITNESGLLDVTVNSFVKKEVQLLKYVRNRGLVEIDKLPSSDDLWQLLKKYDNSDESIWELVCQAYNMKVKLFEDFQNGANLWEYDYTHRKSF